MKRLFAALCAGLMIVATMAPAAAAEGRHHGSYGGRGHYRHHDRDHHGDAVAAGVIGLVLGAVIASAASQPRREPEVVYAPPPGPARDQYGYPIEPGPPSAYGDDDGYEGDQCFRRERVWDEEAGRYTYEMHPIPC